MEILLRVGGMMTARCAKSVTKALLAVPGVESANADFYRAEVSVKGTAPVETLERAVVNAGYIIVKYE